MKNIVLIILIVFCLPIGAQSTVGTKITSTVVPNDSLDDIATHADFFGQGGYRSVKNTIERDAIKTSRRKEGMQVYVLSDSTTYILKGGISNSFWKQLASKSGDTITSLKRLDITGSDTLPINASYNGTYFAITQNGGIISGIGHDSIISDSMYGIIGRGNSQRGKEGISIGTNVKNYADSSIIIGKNLINSNRSSLLIGYGINSTKPLQPSIGNALMLGYNDTLPAMTISRDTVKVRGKLLINGVNPITLWQNNMPDTAIIATQNFTTNYVTNFVTSYMKKVVYTYSSAYILANTTRNLIESPGAGYYINPISVSLSYIAGASAYASNTTVLIKIGTYTLRGGGISLSINTASNKHVPLVGMEQNLATTTPVSFDAQSMTIGMSATNTVGNGYIKVVVLYTIESVL